MSTRRETAERLLAELVSKRAEIKTLEADVKALEEQLDRLLPDEETPQPPASTSTRTAIAKGQQQPGSLAHRLLTRINGEPSRMFAADDFSDLANGSSMQTIRAGLLRLYGGGSIERPRRGRFKATKAVREAARAAASGGDA